MDALPNWVWWTFAGGVLLSPVIAFLLAVLVEILIGVLSQGGLPALFVLAAVMGGCLALRRRRPRPRTGELLGDQA